MDLLDKISKEKISKVVNENTSTALRTEIARINKKETGKCIFPYESWEVKIWSNDHNPPHFHILRDNWNVSFEIESGKLYKVESQGREQKILQYMQDNVANWLESSCFLQTKLTNKENAMSTWVQLHDGWDNHYKPTLGQIEKFWQRYRRRPIQKTPLEHKKVVGNLYRTNQT